MFGRIRPSSSSPESLQRPPSKIPKDDPLSIYEATLMKLKLGSQRELSSPLEQTMEIETDSALSSPCDGAMKINENCTSASSSKSFQDIAVSSHEEAMMIDTDCSSASISLSSIDSHPMGSTEQQRNMNVSVLYLFSKFKTSRHTVSSSCEEVMPIEDGGSVSISPSSSDCQSLGSMEQQLEQECLSSFTCLPDVRSKLAF